MLRTSNLTKPFTLIISSLFAITAWAGEFGNHCTTGLAKGSFIETKCEINETYEDKTYCFGNEEARQSFLSAPKSTIEKAAKFYALKQSKSVEIERIKITQSEAIMQIKGSHCDLSNKDAGYLALDGQDLRHCTMQNTSFFGTDLRGANLSGSNLQGAYLNLARLEKANFSGANLQDATLFQAIFDKTNFKNANLSNARIIGTLVGLDMSYATIQKGRYGLDIANQPMGAMRFEAIGGKFSHSNFEGSDINRANLQFADLTNANLRNTDMFRADLSKADLTGADITGANFSEAILDGTIMTDVKGLEAIKGYKAEKGVCINCTPTPVAAQPALDRASAAKQMTHCPLTRGHALQITSTQ